MYCDVCVSRKTCDKILGTNRNVPRCFSPYGAIRATKEIDCSREYYWISGFHKDFPDMHIYNIQQYRVKKIKPYIGVRGIIAHSFYNCNFCCEYGDDCSLFTERQPAEDFANCLNEQEIQRFKLMIGENDVL